MHTLFERALDRSLASLSVAELERLEQTKGRYKAHFDDISRLLYEALPASDQSRFVCWFAKRWAGIDRVPADEFAAYEAEVKRVSSQHYPVETMDGKPYKRLSLIPQGFRGELLTYPWMLGIHDFLFDQYLHAEFRIQPGDTIIDAGAFVGDTALLFYEITGGDCEIHAFEVLEENLNLLRHNLSTNEISECVTICGHALTNKSNNSVHIKATPVQGATSIFGTDSGTAVQTITIDDYVSKQSIARVDLIKMDIEGAERLAPTGAIETIRRDRPRLAICIYHLWDDISVIPRIINASGVHYNFSFKWVELRNGWEAVLLCTPAAKN